MYNLIELRPCLDKICLRGSLTSNNIDQPVRLFSLIKTISLPESQGFIKGSCSSESCDLTS